MKFTLHDRLLRRELGDRSRYSSFRGIYGDRSWVDNLDVVNELGGHSGCVNALSWSSSGRLLASGSDDQHLNIHSYQPDSSTAPFALTTTVSTGHTANIFSVKFMPHSNDRTLVTAAGDAEVRVFDIEYSGRTAESSASANIASTARGQRFQNKYRGVRYLTDGNTNARVYRSHSERVKRIVTESSPNLFLTCSEDGEVRQFDLRLPSSAYPPPRGGRGFLSHRPDHDDSNVPPPLISYKRFNLDLNTISCSPSQPHYIALGGAHLHCFLHDRRMLGRDLGEERGESTRASPAMSMTSAENEEMGQATRCVRKFAPEGRKKMRRTDNGHITACKISDANPNEMIVSWSGDHIYSFDLVNSSDASDRRERGGSAPLSASGKGKARESVDRKRKREKKNSSGSLDADRNGSKARHARDVGSEDGDMALRVRYENGQSEDIAMRDIAPKLPQSELESARETVLTEPQKRGLRIARSSVKIRKLMFSLEASSHVANGSLDPSRHVTSFTSALGFAASCLPEMDDISKSWRYPVGPLEEDVVLQQTLRGNRDSSRRFVQAAGTLARVLGGRLQTASQASSPALEFFREICPGPHDGPPASASTKEIFRYDFLKAILLWLEGGIQSLLQGFKLPPSQRKTSARFPIPDDAELSAVHEILIPYLLRQAGGNSIPNVDASRFEHDETRQTFTSEASAVIAFSSAIMMPLEDLSQAVVPSSNAHGEMSNPTMQDRKTAIRYWGFKVGRGLLMLAAEGVNYQFVDTAFGGLGTSKVEEGPVQDDIDLNEEEQRVESISLVDKPNQTLVRDAQDNADEPAELENIERRRNRRSPSRQPGDSDLDLDDADSEAEVVLVDDLHNEIADRMADEDDYDEEDDDEEDDDGNIYDEDEDADDGDITAEERSFMFRSASDRGKVREKVERNIPCYSHTRQYRGHCNVKTVKDANFFGLNDDYVVSGSDGGHLFIWDKKTSELVNILEGDNEVVNVIQGHPTEPLLAVSGIDHTIKIFSPDARAQRDASAGINISSATSPASGYSSLSRRRHNPDNDRNNHNNNSNNEHEGLASRKRMHQSYQIVSQNEVQRQGGMRDAFVTRGMLAQLAARLRARQAGGDGGGGGFVVGEDGEAVSIDDNCVVM